MLSLIGAGIGLLGNGLSALGGTKRTNDWIENPEAPKFMSAAEMTKRHADAQAQLLANVGAFKDNVMNQKAANAGAGALAQAGGAYNGSLINAGNAGTTLMKALNYGNTLESQAMAANMRNQAGRDLMNDREKFVNMRALQQTEEPDLIAKLGAMLSGAGKSASAGRATFRDLFEKG